MATHDHIVIGGRRVLADKITIDGADYFQPIDKVAFGADGAVIAVETVAPLPTRAYDGMFNYTAGAAPVTIDIPAAARLRRVSVVAGTANATVTIGAGQTITIPAGAAFDELIPGDAIGADVVIGGSIVTYYVAWVV